MLFFLSDSTPHYMAILAFLYFVKGLWHLFHRRLIEDDAACLNDLRLATVSNAVVATIFGVYSLLFIAHVVLAPVISLPPIVKIDLDSEAFKLIMGIFIIGVVAALEVYYSVCHRILKELTDVE